MKDYLTLAKENQAKAWSIIRDAQIIEAWRGAGAEINLVGSLKLGLLMKHRDIDFHVYFDTRKEFRGGDADCRLSAYPENGIHQPA